MAPRSRGKARFLELPLPDAAKRAILWDNCARYYGLT
jgi:predicted TIM-barrel fold metal-dependent hydrolase